MAQLKRKGNIGQGAMDDLYKSIFSRNMGFLRSRSKKNFGGQL